MLVSGLFVSSPTRDFLLLTEASKSMILFVFDRILGLGNVDADFDADFIVPSLLRELNSLDESALLSMEFVNGEKGVRDLDLSALIVILLGVALSAFDVDIEAEADDVPSLLKEKIGGILKLLVDFRFDRLTRDVTLLSTLKSPLSESIGDDEGGNISGSRFLVCYKLFLFVG